MKIKKYLPAFIDFEREVPTQEFSTEKILEVDFVKSVYDMEQFSHFIVHADAITAYLKDKTAFIVALISREDNEEPINRTILKVEEHEHGYEIKTYTANRDAIIKTA